MTTVASMDAVANTDARLSAPAFRRDGSAWPLGEPPAAGDQSAVTYGNAEVRRVAWFLGGRKAARRTSHRPSDQRVEVLRGGTGTNSVIVIEDLAVKNIVRNRHLARVVDDAGRGEFRRILADKATWCDGRIVVANRFYPSSNSCLGCGAVKAEGRCPTGSSRARRAGL